MRSVHNNFVGDWTSQVILEIRFFFSSSGGPGGQHVNKTQSAATLVWDLFASRAFNDEEKRYLFSKLQNRLTKNNELHVRSEVHRSAHSNQQECIEKFCEVIHLALQKPKVRKKTKPTKSAVRKRLESKVKRSNVKSNRKKVDW